MTESTVIRPVTLTDKEAAQIDAQARTQGVTPPEYLGYCARVGAFGVLYAIETLPTVGQVGPQKSEG